MTEYQTDERFWKPTKEPREGVLNLTGSGYWRGQTPRELDDGRLEWTRDDPMAPRRIAIHRDKLGARELVELALEGALEGPRSAIDSYRTVIPGRAWADMDKTFPAKDGGPVAVMGAAEHWAIGAQVIPCPTGAKVFVSFCLLPEELGAPGRYELKEATLLGPFDKPTDWGWLSQVATLRGRPELLQSMARAVRAVVDLTSSECPFNADERSTLRQELEALDPSGSPWCAQAAEKITEGDMVVRGQDEHGRPVVARADGWRRFSRIEEVLASGVALPSKADRVDVLLGGAKGAHQIDPSGYTFRRAREDEVPPAEEHNRLIYAEEQECRGAVAAHFARPENAPARDADRISTYDGAALLLDADGGVCWRKPDYGPPVFQVNADQRPTHEWPAHVPLELATIGSAVRLLEADEDALVEHGGELCHQLRPALRAAVDALRAFGDVEFAAHKARWKGEPDTESHWTWEHAHGCAWRVSSTVRLALLEELKVDHARHLIGIDAVQLAEYAKRKAGARR